MAVTLKQIAKKAGISPELAYAIAEATAEKAKPPKSDMKTIDLASNGEAKLIKSFGGRKKFLYGMEKYVERLRTYDPRALTTREQVLDDFMRRGLTRAEAEAFIDQHKFLGKYTVEVEPVMKEVKKKLKINAKDLIEINEALESEMVDMAKYFGKSSLHGTDYSKTYIESGLHQLYKDIAKERGLDYSVVAAIGERIYREKQAEIEEELRKTREKSRGGARKYKWGSQAEEEQAKREEAERRQREQKQEEKEEDINNNFDENI